MNANSRPELDELLGAYALDAIEPVERFEMEQYLHDNVNARQEVDELRETAALLALLQVQREPIDEHVWDDIQSAIHEPAPSVAPAEVVPLHDATRDQLRSERRRRAVPLPVAALLVAAAAIAIVLLAARHNTTPAHSVAAQFNQVVSHGGSQTAIVGKNGTLAHVVRANDGSGFLRVDHMPALPQGHVYQLWVISPGRTAPISAGVLGRNPHAYSSFLFQGKIEAYALSVEKAPGATTPSTPIGEGAAPVA
ncbi:MAG TPA: anti-sigma factor [Acidimicrobiia bacterium]|jgi:anti-sigma factor RsiW